MCCASATRSSTSSRHADEAFLTDNGIIKGAMNLIDADRAEPALRAHGAGDRGLGRQRRQHGGGHRQLRRTRSAYFGKVAEDHARRHLLPTTSAPRASPSTPSR
jgi:hypothetical protein